MYHIATMNPEARKWLPWSILALLALVGAGVAIWRNTGFAARSVMPDVVVHADLSAVEPAIRNVIERATEAARQHPQDARRRADLAMALHANGLAASAQPVYEQAIALETDRARLARLWYLHAAACAEDVRMDLALHSIEQSIEYESSHGPSYWQRGLWLLDDDCPEDAEAAFQEALRLEADSVPAEVGLARVHLRRGEYQQAAARLEQALRRSPMNESYIQQLLGASHRGMGVEQYQDHAAGRVSAAAPMWPTPWIEELSAWRVGYRAALDSANQQISMRRFAEAIPHIERILAERPNDILALNYYSMALAGLGRQHDAFGALGRAIVADPDSAMTHVRLSQMYEQTDLEKCTHHAKEAVRCNPNSGYQYRQLGRAYGLANRPADAADALARAVNHGAHDSETRLLLGRMLNESGRPAEAERVLRQAIVLAPESAGLCVALARACAEQGRFDEAISWLDRGRALNPQEVAIPFVSQRISEMQTKAPKGRDSRPVGTTP